MKGYSENLSTSYMHKNIYWRRLLEDNRQFLETNKKAHAYANYGETQRGSVLRIAFFHPSLSMNILLLIAFNALITLS